MMLREVNQLSEEWITKKFKVQITQLQGLEEQIDEVIKMASPIFQATTERAQRGQPIDTFVEESIIVNILFALETHAIDLSLMRRI